MELMRPPSPGRGYEWMPDPEWRPTPPERKEKKCRSGAGAGRKMCGRPTELEVSRATTVRDGVPRYAWWSYCAACAHRKHGRMVEGEWVYGWRLLRHA